MSAVLFDFNGVLVDDEDLHFEAFRQVLAVHGIDLTRTRYYAELLGFDDAGLFDAVLPGLSPEARRALIDDKARVYAAESVTGLRLFAGVPELLARLTAHGLPMGVVSGALRHEIEGALGRFDLARHFGFVVAAEDVERCKPDPEGYRKGFERHRKAGAVHSCSECVVIEDSPPGIAAAKAAGMKVIGVAHTVGLEALAQADRAVPSLAELDASDVVELLETPR